MREIINRTAVTGSIESTSLATAMGIIKRRTEAALGSFWQARIDRIQDISEVSTVKTGYNSPVRTYETIMFRFDCTAWPQPLD